LIHFYKREPILLVTQDAHLAKSEGGSGARSFV